MRQRLKRIFVLCVCIFSMFGSLVLFSIPASAHSYVVAKNTTAFSAKCTYKFNLGTSYAKSIQGSCDAQRYIMPNTACGQGAEQDGGFYVNGDYIATRIIYHRDPNPYCGNIYINSVAEGVFTGSHPVTWYGFTYYTTFFYATCLYLNGYYGHFLTLYPGITAPAGHQPLWTNYKAVGCTGSAQGNYTPALN